jgi:hypothetical protein
MAGLDSSRHLAEYLLDGLPEEERAGIENRYSQDDEFFSELQAAEEELIRDYLKNDLARPDRARFEKKYLTVPSLRKKVELTAALMKVQPATEGPRGVAGGRWIWQAWLPVAAAFAVLVVVAAEHGVEIRRLGAAVEGLRARPAVVARTSASFLLRPGAYRRGEQAPVVLALPQGVDDVSLSLQIEPGNEAAEYQAVLSTPEGSQIWGGIIAGGAGSSPVATIPARLLGAGDYVLTLDGAGKPSAHETYTFSLTRALSHK